MTGALEKIRVVDMTQALAGPYCTMLLGDLGADVIKIERPDAGDQSRTWGPPFIGDESVYYIVVNRNKRGITLNIASTEGQKILHRLNQEADVFVTNLPRLETMRKLRCDYETLSALNPRLIFCAISGYGHTGPRSGEPGYDIISQGESGLMSITGSIDGEPTRFPTPIADMTTGMYSAMAILAALVARNETGQGQFIDTSLHESYLSWLENVAASHLNTGVPPARYGNAHPNVAPYQPFRARDKDFIVGVGADSFWDAFCKILGIDYLQNDPRFATNAARVEHREELGEIVQQILATRDADDWIAEMKRAGIPCGPINSVPEALKDPQTLARGMIIELTHPQRGPVKSLGNPMHLSETPVAFERAAPRMGEHTESVLRELGFSDQEIGRWRQQGVV